MNLKRILQHMISTNFSVRRKFPKASLDRITEAVSQAEKGHHGEIRFAVEHALDLSLVFRGVTPRLRAIKVFSDLGVWDTEENNGVLIYLLLADRQVEIVADRGLHARVGDEGWEKICLRMEMEFRQGRFEAGAIEGIQAVGALLKNFFPRTESSGKGGSGADTNELPDRPVVV